MRGRLDLTELGERIAEEGTHRYEWALRELALAVRDHAPGAAAVLSDQSAPDVLRERAFSVVAGVLLRRSARLPVTAVSSDRRVGEEVHRQHLDWEGELVGWGA